MALLFPPRAAAQQTVSPSTAIPAIAATYGFNEGSGSTTTDASGNANTATLYGASWTTAGRYGDALSFNGVSSYVEAPNSSSLNPGTAATFSAWVNLAASNDISAVIDKWSQTADDEYLFGLDSSNRLIFAWQTTGGNVWGQPSYNLVSGTAQVPLGTWTYISVVRNGPSISFYINGNIDVTYASAADANPFRSGINTLRIGGQNRGGVARFLNGTIDEVRMYNQARTQAQIQSDMNTLPPLAATYGFNEGSGSTTTDASGNANTATLYGASWTTAGRYGDALSFNGVSSYVEAPNSSSLNPATAATFSAWVNLAANNDISAVIDKWSQTADDEYLFGLDSSSRLIFAWQTTGGNIWGQPSYNLVSGTAQVPLGTWTYISVVRDGPSISFYINGNIDVTYASAADANPFRGGINTLRIGGQNRGGVARFLNGTIDEVRMYNQARTQAQIQSDMNTLKPLAATYGFNEGSGSTTADASGNANTATLYGASWTAGGRYGDALSFNGVSSYVEAPNSSSLNPGTTATFSAWVNLAANNNISAVIDKWSQTADDEYLFGLDSSGRLIFAWQTTGGNVWGQPSYNLVSGTAQVPLGTWTYISVVRDGPSISFYINGNIDATYASAADANPFRSGIDTLRIGGQNRGGVARFLNGTIDELRMYNQARTQAQIQSDMNTPIGSSTLPSPPSITSQPTNQTVPMGQTAAFSVGATGIAPLSYQWQKNGVNISGATAASYTTPAATTVDSGSTFRVVVSNTAGSVTSSAATLTVNPAPAPAIQVSRSSISFGNDAIGTTLSQVLIITNTGTATLSMTQVTESGASAFSVRGFPLPVNVNPGQQTTITVAFLPTSTGPVSGNISIVSNAPTSPTSVALTGTGIAATLTLSLSSTSLSFGNVTTGTSSAPQTVTITNTGNSNVTISQITLSGAGYSITGGSAAVTLTPTQSITVSVLFSPAVAGTVNGGLSIVSNASGSPANVSLSGTGVATVQHSVRLNWTASASTVSGYNIYRSNVSGSGYVKINSSLVGGLTYTDLSVQSGVTYYYVATAVDSSGDESPFSNEVFFLIP